MDELTLLRRLRDEVAEPDPARLATAYEKLEAAMRDASHARSPRIRRWRPIRWDGAGLAAAAAVAAVAAAVVVGGVLSPNHSETASAATVLRGAAAEALAEPDPVAGPGQYLKFEERFLSDASGAGSTPNSFRTRELYIPANLDDEWVQIFRGGGQGTSVRRGAAGSFFGDGTSLAQELRELANIPTGSGAETLAFFDAQYQGGSTSREEDDWKRITDLLESYPLPAVLRARLFEALALIPGTTSTPGVANLDGTLGVAIGRTEPNRENSRREIILDPQTGRLIGTRELPGAPYEPSVTTISTTIVDAAPR